MKKFRLKIAVALFLLALAVAGFRSRYSLTITWGPSMEPTFHHGAILLVDRWSYKRTPPARGDVVIARGKDELLVKRVVALPGEHVKVQRGLLHVNEQLIPETYLSEGKSLEIEGGLLRPNSFALLGDNRDASSRNLVSATAPKEAIIGEVVYSFSLNLASFPPAFGKVDY